MMVKTQFCLDPELLRRARRRAAEQGISLAEYLRRLLARDLEIDAPSADPTLVCKLGSSGGSDVARNEDDMIGEAVAARRRS